MDSHNSLYQGIPGSFYCRIIMFTTTSSFIDSSVFFFQLCTEVETLKSRIAELESQVHNAEYFAMMYKLAADEAES